MTTLFSIFDQEETETHCETYTCTHTNTYMFSSAFSMYAGTQLCSELNTLLIKVKEFKKFLETTMKLNRSG